MRSKSEDANFVAERIRRCLEHEWLTSGRIIELSVAGACMGDAVPDGSRIRVAMGNTNMPNAGDIVLVRRGCTRYIHRNVVAIGSIGLEKGDKIWWPKFYTRSMLLGVLAKVDAEN